MNNQHAIAQATATLFNASNPQTGYGGHLKIKPETIKKLGQKFDTGALNKLLSEYGIAKDIYGLTNRQAGYFATFKSLDRIRNSFAQSGFTPNDRYNAEKVGQVPNPKNQI